MVRRHELTDEQWARLEPLLPPQVSGYSSKKIRRYLGRWRIRYPIPRRSNERRTGPFDRALYRTRNRVERLINQLAQFRRVATRYEKYAENYRAMVLLRCVLLWL
jgi:transposase